MVASQLVTTVSPAEMADAIEMGPDNNYYLEVQWSMDIPLGKGPFWSCFVS